MTHSPAKILRLILGDQLNPQHPWFTSPHPDVLFVLMEIRQETDYVLHHAQKILAIFAAMRDFARSLSQAGHRLHYLAIDSLENTQSLTANIDFLMQHYQANRFEYQAPDEWRLDQQLAAHARQSMYPCQMVDSAHFYTRRDEGAEIFAHRKQWLMEHFYRQMRTRHHVLMTQASKPAGGKWNYDHDNRKAWSGAPPEPEDRRIRHDHSLLWQAIQQAGIASFGQPQANQVLWPLNRHEALQHLENFVTKVLPYFGDFQDAMHTSASRLFHSQLSFALNTKMLHPREVVGAVEQAWLAGKAPLPAAEGFIRQILGWREYVRVFYWAHMPDYPKHNFFGHSQALPAWFWTGQTRMRCLAHAIGQSLEQAHAHHIQRLMVIGNFALLAGLNPTEVHHWYLGIYIDAFEWVELPNTLGMSQYADGGLLATKPYVSSAAYIDRMSNYCQGCHYDKKQRIGERACPFNALYWDFFDAHKTKLQTNPRLSIVYKQLSKMDPSALHAIKQQARTTKARLDTL